MLSILYNGPLGTEIKPLAGHRSLEGQYSNPDCFLHKPAPSSCSFPGVIIHTHHPAPHILFQPLLGKAHWNKNYLS